MRFVLLAALMAALVMPHPVEAARRDDRPQVSRSAPASTVGRAAAPAASRATAKPEPAKAGARQAASRPTNAARSSTPQAAARPAASRQAALRPGDVRTQRQGVVVRGAAAATLPRAAAGRTATRSDASCTRRNGRTICSAPVERPLSWQAGLPSASNAQRDCPAGTLATLARGHNDIVRCMPL